MNKSQDLYGAYWEEHDRYWFPFARNVCLWAHKSTSNEISAASRFTTEYYPDRLLDSLTYLDSTTRWQCACGDCVFERRHYLHPTYGRYQSRPRTRASSTSIRPPLSPATSTSSNVAATSRLLQLRRGFKLCAHESLNAFDAAEIVHNRSSTRFHRLSLSKPSVCTTWWKSGWLVESTNDIKLHTRFLRAPILLLRQRRQIRRSVPSGPRPSSSNEYLDLLDDAPGSKNEWTQIRPCPHFPRRLLTNALWRNISCDGALKTIDLVRSWSCDTCQTEYSAQFYIKEPQVGENTTSTKNAILSETARTIVSLNTTTWINLGKCGLDCSNGRRNSNEFDLHCGTPGNLATQRTPMSWLFDYFDPWVGGVFGGRVGNLRGRFEGEKRRGVGDVGAWFGIGSVMILVGLVICVVEFAVMEIWGMMKDDGKWVASGEPEERDASS